MLKMYARWALLTTGVICISVSVPWRLPNNHWLGLAAGLLLMLFVMTERSE